MSEWRDINDPPTEPTKVLFYLARAKWHNREGAVVDIPDLYAVRYTIGHWDGETWRDQYTNHEVFEFPDNWDLDDKPTHWAPLMDGPEATASSPPPSEQEAGE